MSIATELTNLAANRDAIKAAIEAKNPATAPGAGLASFPAAIASIPDGGVGGEWEPPSDWPDIRRILADDVTPQAAVEAGATHKWIMLCDGPYYGAHRTYDFTAGESVYFRVADATGAGYEQAASMSLHVEPLANGVPFWIIVYAGAEDAFDAPGPHGQPYAFTGPLWVYAPSMVRVGTRQSIAGYRRLRSITLRGFGGHYDYLTFMYSNELLENLETSFFEPSSVGNTFGKFGNYGLRFMSFDRTDFSLFTTMASMFSNCYSLESLDVSGWDVGAVTTMASMFNNCYSLEPLDVSGWDVGAVTTMANMFINCYSLESLIGGQSVAANGSIGGSTAYWGKGPRVALSVAQCNNLDHDSLLFLLYWVQDRTGQTALTMTLGNANKAKLTADEIAVAAAKNWTIA